MANTHRLLVRGILTSLLLLSVLGFFIIDFDLPSELHAFKTATLSKLKFGTDTTTPPDGSQSHILPTPAHFNNDGSHQVYPGSESLSSQFKTTIPNGATIQGFSIFDNLVMHNGTFYIVTDNPGDFPAQADIARKPDKSGEWGDREPAAEDFQFITPDKLMPLLGDSAIRIEGFNWIMYDIWQFMRHYYHWWGEIILGGWRVYSLLGLDSNSKFHPERLQFPNRFLLPMVTDGKWRDRAAMVGPFMRAVFPHAAIEERDQWLDLIRLNSTFVFSRALITNRKAAHAHPWGSRWFKMIAGTQALGAPEFDPTSLSPSHEGFWSPLRKSLTHNLLGYIPEFTSLVNRTVTSPPSDKSEKPVVTYIDRQGTGRRLTEESHKSLTEALLALQADGVCEVQIVRMENVPLREQVRLVARSAIIVGVHGNGLTIDFCDRLSPDKHQLWMPPWKRSTVIEIVYPEGYAFDYEMLARNMGHKHYMVWNDTLITYPKGTYHKGVRFPEGFHSSKIYVHGPAVAEKIKECLLDMEGKDIHWANKSMSQMSN